MSTMPTESPAMPPESPIDTLRALQEHGARLQQMALQVADVDKDLAKKLLQESTKVTGIYAREQNVRAAMANKVQLAQTQGTIKTDVIQTAADEARKTAEQKAALSAADRADRVRLQTAEVEQLRQQAQGLAAKGPENRLFKSVLDRLGQLEEMGGKQTALAAEGVANTALPSIREKANQIAANYLPKFYQSGVEVHKDLVPQLMTALQNDENPGDVVTKLIGEQQTARRAARLGRQASVLTGVGQRIAEATGKAPPETLVKRVAAASTIAARKAETARLGAAASSGRSLKYAGIGAGALALLGTLIFNGKTKEDNANPLAQMMLMQQMTQGQRGQGGGGGGGGNDIANAAKLLSMIKMMQGMQSMTGDQESVSVPRLV